MLDPKDKKELLNQISDKRREVSGLQAEMNSLNDKKEAAFRKKTELSKKILSLINEIKANRDQRDSLTKQVQQTKEDRDKHNREVKDAVEGIKDIEKERDALLKKHKIKKNPSYILKQIADLDMKIETEPMSFEKEKKIMKQIKDLKKGMEQAKAVSGVLEKAHEKSMQIDDLKKKAQKTHKKVQSTAKESQEKHESILEASKEIDCLKKEEEGSFKKFIDCKKSFIEVNEKLKQKLTELNELRSKIDSDSKEKKKKTAKRKDNTLKQKQLDVEEKIRKRMKLTTEDLLAFQSIGK